MDLTAYERALTVTGDVIANVKPDQYDAQTPCKDWKVKDLINHIIGGAFFFAGAADGKAPEGEAPDFTEGDITQSYEEAKKTVIAAFSQPGVESKIISLPFGDMPGAAVMGIHMLDNFQHGWDLAKATGQSTDLDPELAGGILGHARQTIQPAFRSDDGAVFGPEVAVPETAPAADQLAGFLGRQV